MTLTFGELVAQSGVDAAVARELVAIGVAGRTSEPFERADVQRIITGAAYLDAGFTIEQLRSAIESHTISFAFADALDREMVLAERQRDGKRESHGRLRGNREPRARSTAGRHHRHLHAGVLRGLRRPPLRQLGGRDRARRAARGSRRPGRALPLRRVVAGGKNMSLNADGRR